MVRTGEITIPELTGDEKRRAYVYLPDSYQVRANKRYPVLYMFDGHNVFFDSDATFGKCWGLKEYLDTHHTEVIVAAVECNHSPDHGRLKEYSPFSFSDPHFGEIIGKGKITMDWLVGTFKPYIDKNYRTLKERDYTWIAGSSMGGLMSLYALVEYNHVFSRAAALSPSIWTNTDLLEEMIRNAELAKNTVLYMDYGSDELANHRDILGSFADMTALLLKKGVQLESRIVPGGNHSEASWERQLPFFMHALMYNVKPPVLRRNPGRYKGKKTKQTTQTK